MSASSISLPTARVRLRSQRARLVSLVGRPMFMSVATPWASARGLLELCLVTLLSAWASPYAMAGALWLATR